MSSSVSPLAPAAGSSSRVPRPAIGHDRNAPIVQAPPRPGIEYVQNEHGLPSARRVPAQSAPRPSTAYQGYHSSQESTPSATSRVPNWEDSRYYASRPK
ncbi:hypothetical protein BV22DRAFT_1005662 [Leucogyrophana mollusca]|uniref:Uncharacterized protein n=1 Tax=Leucogyrophana mollusca TaxID=85980 RepID=A0ACB8BSI1_9AGAM|nr:hypothetical protein BV22DRAFT_1005662 [Leucogyrophana mollusca]